MRPLKIAAAVLCWLLIILAILFTVLDIQLSPESARSSGFCAFIPNTAQRRGSA